MLLELTPFEWIAAALGLALLPFLAFRLHENNRSQLPVPLLFFLAFVGLTLERSQVYGQPRQVLDVLAFFCCLAFLGHEGLLLGLWLRFTRRGEPVPALGLRSFVLLVYALAVVFTLLYAGVPVVNTLFLAALAILTLLVMFRHILADLAAGLFLKGQQAFAKGDWIEIPGSEPIEGEILKVNWQGTILTSPAGGEVLIPNRLFLTRPVWNRSRRGPGFAQTLTIDCPISAPPAVVRQALYSALTACPGILEKPAPSVHTQDFQSGKATYQLSFSVSDLSLAPRTRSDLRDRLWCALNRAGISLAPKPEGPPNGFLESNGTLPPTVLHGRLRLLRKVPWFLSLTDQALEQLAHQARTLWYATGEMVVRQGESSTEMFVIHRGQVVVTAHGEGGGSEMEVNRLGPETCFGEMAMLTGEKRLATVRALEDCELLAFERSTFGALLAQEPELVSTIREELKKRQTQLDLCKEQSTKVLDRDKVVPGSLVDRFLHHFGLFS